MVTITPVHIPVPPARFIVTDIDPDGPGTCATCREDSAMLYDITYADGHRITRCESCFQEI